IRISFLLLALTGIANAAAFDVFPNYFIVKMAKYDQTSASAPVLAGTGPYQLGAYVEGGTPTSITSGSVTSPSGSPGGNLTLSADGGVGDFSTGQNYSSLSALDSAFLSGTYNLSIQGTHGNYNANLLVSGTFAPGVATITNTNWVGQNLQISSTAALTLTWTLAGAVSTNVFFLQIHNQNTGNVQKEITLPGTATSYTLPSALAAGDYNFELDYVNVSGSNSTDITGATGYGGIMNSTQFNVTSVPEPSSVLLLVAGGSAVTACLRRRRV
ncbi:MAG: PEP-CTERM sorting domain-containing protein, partial [Verrucomicrobiota bacterium]